MTPKNVNCRKTILGKYEVTYDCPGCGESLKNDLDDAGTNDQCPHCECEFVVPGSGYKRDLERRRAERIAEKEKEAVKREAEQREAERVKAEQREAENQQAKWREADRRYADRIARNEILEIRAKNDKRTSIHHISEGLSYFSLAIACFVISEFFGALSRHYQLQFSSLNEYQRTGDAVDRYISLIGGTGIISFCCLIFGSLPSLFLSFMSFSKGSKA